MIPFDLPPFNKLWLPPKPAIIQPHKPIDKLGFLPGFLPPGAAAAVGPVTLLTQVGTGTSTATNGAITSSVTIQRGDLLVIWGYSTGLSSSTVPPGFTAASTVLTGASELGIFYKIADGTEGTSVTGCAGTGAGAAARNALYVFRGDNPVVSVTAADPDAVFTGGNPVAQTVTSSAGTPPLVVIGGYWGTGGSTIDPRTFTVGGSPAKDGEISTANDFWLAYKIYNASPANVVVDADDDATDIGLASCYLMCS